ncbi:hypothetical protein [Pseudomonas asplenii]|uniref:hypothetical protein n=1 Tax=Pseudomonas asplenii TaxID=53407 RepID=UPI0037C7F66C
MEAMEHASVLLHCAKALSRLLWKTIVSAMLRRRIALARWARRSLMIWRRGCWPGWLRRKWRRPI